MAEKTGLITFHGNPLTLVGDSIRVGDKARDFSAVKNDLSPFRLSDVKGKVVVLVSVPSLDTPVCDVEAQRFHKEAANLGSDAVVVVISMDLPFAQARWCGAANAKQIITVSDHRDGDFAMKYGQMIKELRLLARSVVVIDKTGSVRYLEQVKELTHEPNYEAALQAVQAAI